MKQPKKLTRVHKEYLQSHNLDPRFWMLQSESADRFVYVNKIDGSIRERIKHDAYEAASTEEIIQAYKEEHFN